MKNHFSTFGYLENEAEQENSEIVNDLFEQRAREEKKLAILSPSASEEKKSPRPYPRPSWLQRGERAKVEL